MTNGNHPHPDHLLIDRFCRGDNDAAESLILRYQKQVYTTIYYLVKDKALADDLFQDTFLKALTQIANSNYVEQGKFLPWVLRIAHNLCIDHFRRSKQQVRIVSRDGTDIMDCMGDHEGCHEEHIVKGEVESSVQQMIERLSDCQREVVVMRIYGELSFKEIADATGVSINTALGRMRYALQNLRKMMAEEKLLLR